jgi:hypothetical protein
MPLVFIHGVNTRNTDDGYQITVSARKRLFERFLVPTLQRHGFNDFAVKDDIYWGDLGVTFAWRLQAIPDVSKTDFLGPGQQGKAIPTSCA